MGSPARLLRCVRRRHGQPLEGHAAVQLLRLVGPVSPRLRLLPHACRGPRRLQHGRRCQDPAQRPRQILRA